MVDNYNANGITGIWLILVLITVAMPSLVFAKSTNVNEVNTLFEDHIENKDEYFNNLENLRDESSARIESKSGLSSIKEIDKVDSFSSQINSIEPYDLEAEASKVRASEEYRFYDEHEMAPDWSRDGNRMHRQDAEDITSAIAKKLKSLTQHLEALGLDFDCTEQKKPAQIDASFSLDIKRNPKENVEFDQIFCEEAWNKYSCRDKLSLTCKKKGMKWDEWEERDIELPGSWIHWNRRWWTYAIKWRKKRFGIHLHPGGARPDVAASIREHIMEKLGISDEQIHKEVNVSARGEGAINHIEGKGYIWETFRIGYKYRDGKEICQEWSQDWDERCVRQGSV